MNAMLNRNLGIAGAACAAALVAGACALVEPRAEGPTIPPIGSSWSQKQTNSGSFGKGTRTVSFKVTGDREWQGRKVRALDTGAMTFLMESTANKWVTWLAKGKPILSWDPPVGYDYPMYVGKKWTTKHQFTMHAAKRTVPLEVNFDIEAHESVTAPAGTFDTFRIRASDNLGTESVTWYSPEIGLFIKRVVTRTAKHPAGPGRQEQELLTQTIRK
ncbi:MAG TPA: hypothetical protein VLA41_10140 [Burkholderiales bacterium]|nr:hypothetical protein [Burkholderiales bacterium]